MAKHLILLAVAIAAGLVVAAISTISFGGIGQLVQASAQKSDAKKAGDAANDNNNTNKNNKKDNNPGMSSGDDQRPSFIYTLERKFNQYENGTLTVRAGGGGHLFPATAFIPQRAEIKVGEHVTWINPTLVGEPHTVTFLTDKNYFADFGAPVAVANNTRLTPVIPGSNTEPMMMSGQNGTAILVTVNKRAVAPTVIDAQGNTTYLPPGMPIKIDGTERYVNSGWIWPSGQVPPGFAPIDRFTVTFSKAGTYDYLCIVHPWMTGEVVVK
jgi:plastocyanin